MSWAKLHTDILADPKLMRAARSGLKGLEYLPWLIAFAKLADDNGRLSVGGDPVDAIDIAVMIPAATRTKIANCLQSLEKIGVLSRDRENFLRLSSWESRSGTKPSDGVEAIRERVQRHRELSRNSKVTQGSVDSDNPSTGAPDGCNALRGVTRNAAEETRDRGRAETDTETDTRICTSTQPPTPPSTPTGASQLFQDAWEKYPNRAGSNSRRSAEEAWDARIAEGVQAADMLAGTQRYRRFCEAECIVGTQFVQQASRFFGPNREFEAEWALPSTIAQSLGAIDPQQPMVDSAGCLTEYGDRVTQPGGLGRRSRG